MPEYPRVAPAPQTLNTERITETYGTTGLTGQSGLIGRVFTLASIGEVATWAGLLVGIFLKYVTQTTSLGVTIFGPLHGSMFLLYTVIAIAAGIVLRWPIWTFMVAMLSAVPPLATIPVEMLLRRKGYLAARPGSYRPALEISHSSATTTTRGKKS